MDNFIDSPHSKTDMSRTEENGRATISSDQMTSDSLQSLILNCILQSRRSSYRPTHKLRSNELISRKEIFKL